jgi:hypothetical protein
MSFSKPLKFKVAGRKDFRVLFAVFFLLILLTMAAEPRPLMLTLLMAILSGAGFLVYILGIYKVDDVNLITIIFPGGRVQLESAGKTKIEGFLSGGQWNTSHVTVLRYQTGGKHQQIVLLSAHQHADDYRRLQVWFRQEDFKDTGNTAVSGSTPVSRV